MWRIHGGIRIKWKEKGSGTAMLIAMFFSLAHVSAQESFNATGGNASGSGGSVSYSVGQVAYQTHTGTSGSVSEGVQQPYEISVVTAIEEAKGINLSVTVYPNPTTDYLTLSIDDNVQTRHALSQLSFQLYHINGKLLQKGKITDNQISIIMGDFASATYFLKVMQGDKEIKTFKILKTQ
ncbi:MAG: T9SS type A sorting domain-containing protein [Bacteroidota bacterium]